MKTATRPHVHVPAHSGSVFQALNEIVEVKLGGEATGDTYSVLQVAVAPQGGASILHTHPPQETFYVLDGTFAFLGLDEEGAPSTITATAGAVVHIAAGAPHGYQNIGDTVGRLLLIFQPAGIMEQFLAEIGAPVTDPLAPPPAPEPPDIARLLPVMAKYGITLVPQA